MSKFQKAGRRPSPFNGKTQTDAPEPVNADKLPPVFSFEYMTQASGYSIECCNADHRSALASKLFQLSQMTWMEIRNAPRHGLGSEKIARDALRPAIPPRVTEDVDFLSIRYNGKHPMVGFRDGRTFNVMFLDHTMDVYPHG